MLILVVPLVATLCLFDLSIILPFVKFNNSEVFATAVNGVVGTVMVAPLYTALPLTILKSDR